MTLPLGAHVRVTVRQVYDSQECLNVFYYQSGGLGVGTVLEMITAIWDNLKSQWRPLASSGVTFDRVIGEEMAGDLEFGEYSIPTAERAGTRTGTPMSSFNAYAFKLGRDVRTVKPGSKRLVGVVEEATDGYGVINAAVAAAMVNVATLMLAAVPFGTLSSASAFPILYGAPHPASTRYPERVDPVFAPVTSVVPQPYISTQNTRKRGHGG